MDKIQLKASARIPINNHDFMMAVYQQPGSSLEHISLKLGNPKKDYTTLLRIHSECLTGDLFGSEKCDCGWQLNESIRRIIEKGEGLVIYLRQEGRGIGLVAKLKAYNLQEKGYDTVEANEAIGMPVDTREYSIAVDILKSEGINSVSLMTNNPLKIEGLINLGIQCDRAPIIPVPGKENESYLKVKQNKMSHLFDMESEVH